MLARPEGDTSLYSEAVWSPCPVGVCKWVDGRLFGRCFILVTLGKLWTNGKEDKCRGKEKG